MFVPAKASEALESKREVFARAAHEAAAIQDRYLTAMDEVRGLSLDGVHERLGGVQWPGARLAEAPTADGLVVPFGERWATAREARAWAMEELRGTPTVAVDGSQIAASKEFAVPISLVQVAWFENYHDAARQYLKDVRNEAVTIDERGDEAQEYIFAESRLNQRRFALEMQVAVERIRALASNGEAVVFLDGSFVLSFIGRVLEPSRQTYLSALFGLLDASREHRVPAVGYVDLSFASDVAVMLRTAFDLPRGPVHDGSLLMDRMAPMDRTVAFQCARGDVLPMYHSAGHDYSSELCFVYLMAGHDRPPSRIDFPGWILEAGLLDRLIDVVRAEIVVGGGYPYALETADAAAVLTVEDRLAFYRMFHDFAQGAGLPFAMPGKSISKARRR